MSTPTQKPNSFAIVTEMHRRSAGQVIVRRVTLAVMAVAMAVLNGIWLRHESSATTLTPHAQRTGRATLAEDASRAAPAAEAPRLAARSARVPMSYANRLELTGSDSDLPPASQLPSALPPAQLAVAWWAAAPPPTDDRIPADSTSRQRPTAQSLAADNASAPPQPPATPPPRAESRYQQVDVQRRPTFRIAGLVNTQLLHYRLVSRLELQPPNEAGVRRVVQFVESTQLIAADDLSRESLAKSLERLEKQQFTYELTRSGEVVHFAGHKDNVAEVAFDSVSTKGLLVTSVIDQDGWKELAELTFFVPDPQVRTGQKWRRQLAHDWRSLGKWSGANTYIKRTPRAGLVPIDFVREISFQPGAPGAGFPALPIREARFVVKEAAGTMQFNPVRERVDSAREVFDVAGTLQAQLFGQIVAVELTERQELTVRVTDHRPSVRPDLRPPP